MTPNGWRTITFGDAASLAYGKSLPAAQRKNGVVPVCGANGIIGFHDEPLARGPGIIVGRKGSVGAVTWVDKDFWPIDTTYYVKSKEPSDARWLYYAVSNLGLDKLNEATGIPGLNRSTAAAVTFYVPPLPEQRKIAAILSSVDDAIEKTQAVIAQVQVVKRGLMQELLTRGLPGRHTRFKQTEIGKIPEEWDFLPLRAMAASDRGLQTGPFGSQLHASDYVINGVPVLMPQDMMNGYVSDAFCARIADERAAELSRHRVQAGDILFARRGDLGRAGLITQHEEGWLCGTGCLRFRPKNRTVSRYLRHWIAWSTSVRWLNKHAVGQTMLNLNTSILGSLPVALPCDAERSVIIGVLEAFDEQIRTLEQNTEGLGGVKSALMSILLTGELRVTPDAEVA